MKRKKNENSPFISTFPNSKGKNADKAQNGKRNVLGISSSKCSFVMELSLMFNN